MEKNTFKRLTSTTQAYFDRKGIKEAAKFELKDTAPGIIDIVLHTKQLLSIEDLLIIEGLVFALMPIGVMHEFKNVVTIIPEAATGTIVTQIDFKASNKESEKEHKQKSK